MLLPLPLLDVDADLLILGAGGAGLLAALHATTINPALRIVIAVKGLLGQSGCTRMVQGGYNCVLNPADSFQKHFEDTVKGYAPAAVILPPYPRPELEFGRDSAYGVYNWELTFHAPHLIASKLMEAEQFDDAETWTRDLPPT